VTIAILGSLLTLLDTRLTIALGGCMCLLAVIMLNRLLRSGREA